MRKPRADDVGAGPTTGVRNYLCGMTDATVKILGKLYDGGIAQDLARCHDMPMQGVVKVCARFE